jgi:hypothetical protein
LPFTKYIERWAPHQNGNKEQKRIKNLPLAGKYTKYIGSCTSSVIKTKIKNEKEQKNLPLAKKMQN